MNGKFKFGLIGCGIIGKRHAELITKYGELIAVCDIITAKAEVFANRYQCNYYSAIEDMIESEKILQIAVVCTPNHLHALQSIQLLNSNLHVICEKPMALNINDCNQMISKAHEKNKLLYIVKQNRFNPAITYLKDLIKKDSLGKIFSISMQVFWNRPALYYDSNWRGKKETDGGILFTQFSHFIDILIWLLGEVKDFQVKGSNFNHQGITEFEDTIVGLCSFRSGVLGNFHFSTCAYQKNWEGSLSVLCEKGDIKIGGQYLNTIEYHEIEGISKPSINESENSNDYGYYKGSMSNHHLVYERFFDSLKVGELPDNALEESAMTIDLIQRINDSMRTT